MFERSFRNGQRHVIGGFLCSGQKLWLMPDQVLPARVKPFNAEHDFAEGGFLLP